MRLKLLLTTCFILITLLLASQFMAMKRFVNVPVNPEPQQANLTAQTDPPIEASAQLSTPVLAALQAINTLLLSDEGITPETLVLLYINGDNNLSGAMQTKLIPGILRGATNPEIVVRMLLDWPTLGNSRYYQVDRLGGTCDFLNNYTCGGRYREGQTVRSFPEDLGDPATLTKFIQEATAEVPQAKRVILVLIGHGGGWSPEVLAGQPQGHSGKPGNGDQELGGLLWDDSTELRDALTGAPIGNSLSTLDLQTALQEAGRKIDLLYLDACLMGMWEVGHQIRNQVNYLVASESWSWTSFPYEKHLAAIRNDQSLVQIGGQWLQNEADALAPLHHAYTYSMVDLTQMSALSATLNSLAQQLIPLAQTVDGKAKIRSAFERSDCFDSNADVLITHRATPNSKGIDNYCDLASFVGQLQVQFSMTTEFVGVAQALQNQIKNTVVGAVYGSGVPGKHSNVVWQWYALGGLSIFTPFGEDHWKRGLYSQLEVAKDTAWDDVINKFWNTAAPSVPNCPTGGCELPPGPLTVTNSVYLPLVQQ